MTAALAVTAGALVGGAGGAEAQSCNRTENYCVFQDESDRNAYWYVHYGEHYWFQVVYYYW